MAAPTDPGIPLLGAEIGGSARALAGIVDEMVIEWSPSTAEELLWLCLAPPPFG